MGRDMEQRKKSLIVDALIVSFVVSCQSEIDCMFIRSLTDECLRTALQNIPDSFYLV